MLGRKKKNTEYKKIEPGALPEMPEPTQDGVDSIAELKERIKLMELELAQEKAGMETVPVEETAPAPASPSKPTEKYVEVPVILNDDNVKMLVYENNRILKEILKLARE